MLTKEEFLQDYDTPQIAGECCGTCLYFQPECYLEYDRLPIKYPFIVPVYASDSKEYRVLPVHLMGSCVYYRDVLLVGVASGHHCPRYATIPKERQFKDTALTDINDDGSAYDGPTILAGF